MKWLKTEGFVSIYPKIPNSSFLIPNCAAAREMAIYWSERSRKSMGVNFSLPNRSINRWHLTKKA